MLPNEENLIWYYKLSLPLKVKVSKNKHFILNINNYRNAHHRVLSTAKRNFTDIVLNTEFPRNYEIDKLKAYYYIYPASNRKFDLMNVVSVIDKFFMDALIKKGVIRDDNHNYVPQMPEAFIMPPDKLNPRCEVILTDIS